MEKRQFMRVSSEFFVWYQTIEEDEVSFGKTASKDISAGGIRLELEEPEIMGTCLLMKFQIPNREQNVLAKGKVVWVNKLENGKNEIGIQFYDISEADMSLINEFASSEE